MIHKNIFINYKLCLYSIAILMLSVSANAQQSGKTGAQDPVKLLADSLRPDKGILRLSWNTNIDKKYYTGAVSGTTGKEMTRYHVINNTSALAGKLPGLITRMNSDEPGFDGSSLNVRGWSSFRNNEIATYVDNIPAGFSQLDPLEIDQLLVLKDGQANGVYGMQGANKAVFVTTKRGEAFNNQINVYTSFGLQQHDKLPNWAGAQQYMKWYNEARVNDGLPEQYTSAQISAYDNPNRDPYKYPDADWYDALIKNSAIVQKYNVTLSGGNDVVRYFVLGGFTNQQGLFKNTGLNFDKFGYNTNQVFNRYNLRTNLDFNINKSLTVFLDLSGKIEERTYPGNSSSTGVDGGSIYTYDFVATTERIFYNMSTYVPHLFPVTFSDGKIGGNAQYRSSPYGLVTKNGMTRRMDRVLYGNVGFKQDLSSLLPGLNLQAAFAFYNQYNNFEGFLAGGPQFAVYSMQPDGSLQVYGTDVDAKYGGASANQNRFTTFWAKADYATTFGNNNNHDLSVALGYYQSKQTTFGDDFPYVNVNIFNQWNYKFKKRYIADLTLSYSASEIFPKGHRFGLFPTIGAAWIISDESFMKGAPAVSFLKLRTSYAMLGNSNLGVGSRRGRYLYIDQYVPGSGYTFGATPTGGSGYQEGAIANHDVTWEKQSMMNVGIDVTFLNNTLGFTVDAFHEKRTGILAVPGYIPSMIGASLQPLNIGKVRNNGFDGEIWYRNNAGAFNYKVSALTTLAKNKVLYQGEAAKAYSYMYTTGNPVGTLFGYQSSGFFKDASDITNSPKQLFSQVQAGDVKYKDMNNDQIVDANDVCAIAKSAMPEMYYGFQIDLSYKNFDLRALFQGASGFSINTQGYATYGFAYGSRPTMEMADRWTPATASTAKYPRFSFSNANNYQTSDLWNKNISYLRLKNVELGYNFSSEFLSRLKLKGARFYVSGYNLITWHNIGIDYLDPEYIRAGISSYPRLSNVMVGLNVNL